MQLMTSNLMIFLIIGITLALQPCDVKVDSINLYPSTKETFMWDLKENFFTGPLLKYSMDPKQSFFKIQNPIAQLQEPSPHLEGIDRVTAARALTEKSSYIWRNHFVFIEQEGTTINLFYAVADQGDTSTPPKFHNKLQIQTTSSKVQCFGVSYINDDTFILDCADSSVQPFYNVWYIVDKQGNTQIIDNDNHNMYTVTTLRYSGIVTLTNKIGREYKYLYRATPAYATNYAGLDQSSLIEIYLLNQSGIPVETGIVLDSATLAVLLQVQDPQYFTFSLIDLQVFPDGKVYVLDAFNGVYILELLGSGEWRLIERIDLGPDQVYRFDVKFLLQSDGTTQEAMMVLYNDYLVIYENKKIVSSYLLNFSISYPATAAINQEFILIQNKGTTYIYSTEHQDIIYKEVIEGFLAALVNPYETEAIIITAIDSRRFTFSNGYLVFPSTSTTTTAISSFTLQATDSSKNVCQVQVNYQILDAADYKLYKLNDFSLPAKITDYPGPIQITPLATGPNIQYTQIVNSNLASSVVAKIVNLQELLIEEISLPNSIDVVFSDVLALDDDQKRFYLVLQLKSLHVQIYDCSLVDTFDKKTVCTDEIDFSAPIKLTKDNFVWWTEFDQIHYLLVVSDCLAAIYTTDKGFIQQVGSIEYENDTLNKITSVTFLKNRFYLTLANKKAIDIYEASAPFTRDFSITETLIKSLGFAQDWSPKKVYGNRSHKSYLFFIVNSDNVVVADFHTQITILKVVQCTSGASIAVSVGPDSFFIIQKTSTLNQISEYSLTNISEVVLLKNLPLYWYTIQNPLTTDFCSDTGELFIRALDTKLQQTVILIYGPMRLARDSLLKAIPLGSKIAETTQVHLSSSGQDNMFFYVNNGIFQRIYSYLKTPILDVRPSYEDIRYFTPYKLEFQITNYADSNSIDYLAEVDLINTQKQIRIDQTYLDENPIKIEERQVSYVDLLDEWYFGQAISVTVDCVQCDEYISVESPVSRQNLGEFQGYSIVHATKYMADKTLFLSPKRAIIADMNGKQLTTFSIVIATSTSDNCELLAPTADGTYIFAACYIGETAVVHSTKCDVSGQVPDCHFIGDVKELTGTTKFSKIQVVGNQLLVLNTDPNSPTKKEGSLNIYTIVIEEDDVSFLNVQKIGTSFFNNGKTNYFSDFTIQYYQVNKANQLKIYLVDAIQGLFIMDGLLDDKGVLTYPTTYSHLNVYNYVNSEGYYADSTTKFFQVGETHEPVYSSAEKTFTSYILVTTNNVAHYAFKLVFDAAQLAKGGDLKTKQIIFLLNQYGNWDALNKLSIGDGFAIIPYTDNSRILLANYVIPEIQQGVLAPLVGFTGGILSHYGYPQVNQFIAYINTITTEPSLYANVEHEKDVKDNLVITYRLYNSFQLVVLDAEDKVDAQVLEFHASNTYSNDQGYGMLLITPGPDQSSNKGFLAVEQ